MKRPFIYLNVAMTADGKIAPANRIFVPFGSRRDQELLLELRAQADAVMAGARTVDLFPVNLGPGPKKYRQQRLQRELAEYNLRVIVSGAGTLDPNAKIFQTHFSPILILTTKRIPRRKQKDLSKVADEVKVCGAKEIDWPAALQWLHDKWDVKRLLCEGGGELNDALFRAGVVDELHMTICPLIFGGRTAPTLADGQGIKHLADACQLKMVSKKQIGEEMFLIFRKS
jgi:2,5-diamino-6-(ribosylamino)-4(3H)-pyrimidinone 5'-phosphate reductase